VAVTELHEQRIEAVLAALRSSGAKSVLDLGCGPGPLFERLVGDPAFDRVVGVDISISALAELKQRLPPEATARGLLLHASFTDRDPRLTGFDAAVMLETIEHIEPDQLSKVERAVFAYSRPRVVVITTPNVEYNVLYGMAPGRKRRSDHCFEWPRSKFAGWANGVGARNGYSVALSEIGALNPVYGGPTQMTMFGRDRSAVT